MRYDDGLIVRRSSRLAKKAGTQMKLEEWLSMGRKKNRVDVRKVTPA
ncbi:hypothetical protein ACFLRC_04645 [Candidatus Altiarchaeota archaeon]